MSHSTLPKTQRNITERICLIHTDVRSFTFHQRFYFWQAYYGTGGGVDVSGRIGGGGGGFGGTVGGGGGEVVVVVLMVLVMAATNLWISNQCSGYESALQTNVARDPTDVERWAELKLWEKMIERDNTNKLLKVLEAKTQSVQLYIINSVPT